MNGSVVEPGSTDSPCGATNISERKSGVPVAVPSIEATAFRESTSVW